MPEILIGEPYLEPTQWCVDVWIDGCKTQLTWGPSTRNCPTKEEIEKAITNIQAPVEIIVPTDFGV